MEIDVDVQSNWWSTFFSGPAVDFWMGVVNPEHTVAEAGYLVRQLETTPGAALLDVACGAGRIANALAARGYSVVGVDLSDDFLAHARMADSPNRVEWHRRDMRDLPWPDRFDGAVCVGNSFGYFDDEGNEAFAASLARTLRRGARVVIDTGAIAEAVFPRFVDRSWMEVKDIRFLVARHYDHVHSRVKTEYTFVRDGTVETRWGSQRVYTYGEFVRLFERAGLRVVSAESLDTHGANPYAEGQLATKPFAFGSSGLIATFERI
jgi:SAM-dependent methyltransferase